MTALSADKNTKEAIGNVYSHPVAAAKKCFAGGIAALDASGNCLPGATATTLVAIGRFEEQVDNSGGSAGDLSVKVKAGIFRYANSSGADLITRTEIGDNCYMVDDQTLAKTSGSSTRSVAGRIVDVDVSGVWVALGTY